MKFRAEINCDSVAFNGEPELALAEILAGISRTLRHIGTQIKDRPAVKTPISDVNGIRCGEWSLSR